MSAPEEGTDNEKMYAGVIADSDAARHAILLREVGGVLNESSASTLLHLERELQRKDAELAEYRKLVDEAITIMQSMLIRDPLFEDDWLAKARHLRQGKP